MMPVMPFGQTLQQIAMVDDQARKSRMDRAWDAYYRGAPATLQVKPGQPDDNVRLNKARVVVDKGVSFLFGDELKLKLDETGSEAAQLWLDACLAENDLNIRLHELALNGGVCGHAFLRIEPPGPGETFPHLLVLDPATLDVTWQPDDIRKVARFVIAYSAMDPDTERVLNYRTTVRQAGAGWTIIDQHSKPDSQTWVTDATTAWPHPWPPILETQNLPAPNEWWGISDIEDDVLGLNTQASFALSNSQRIIRWHASPKTVATGVAGPTINVDVDGVILLPNPDATLQNLEMQSDLQSTIAQYEKICEAIHEVARIPEVATGTSDKLGPLSGVALQILYQPLVEKTKTKRLYYGKLLVSLCRRLLELGGYGADNVVTISWPALLPVDPLQERQALLLEDQMGVSSKETIAEKLGLDWETEKDRMAEEAKDAVAAAQAALPPAQVGAAPGADPAQTLPQPPVLNGRQDTGMKGQGTS